MIDGVERSDWMRALPNGKPISALGFGCAAVWAQPSFDAALAERMLRQAFELGVNHFDTSPSYGPIESERRLATLVAAVDRDGLVLSSKVGSNVVDGKLVRSFDVETMRRSFEDSMDRLRLDWLDILYLHGPEPGDLNEETFAFLDDLKRSGRIAFTGVNSFDPATLESVVESPIDVVMLQYNVEDQRCWEVLDRLARAGKTIISGTAIGRGKFDLRNFIPRDRASFFYLARMAHSDPFFLINGIRLRRRLQVVPQPPAATSIQFVTGHPTILSTLFNTRNPQRLAQNITAAKHKLSPDAWTALLLNRGEAALLADQL